MVEYIQTMLYTWNLGSSKALDWLTIKPLDKSAYQENNFLISQPKHMLLVLKRTVSMKRFFWAPTIYAKNHRKENIYNFTLNFFNYLNLWQYNTNRKQMNQMVCSDLHVFNCLQTLRIEFPYPFHCFVWFDAGEARTHNPLVLSQALYHWASTLPSHFIAFFDKLT